MIRNLLVSVVKGFIVNNVDLRFLQYIDQFQIEMGNIEEVPKQTDSTTDTTSDKISGKSAKTVNRYDQLI